MPETIISIDDRALAPWCEVADVLGLSLPQFLEWLIGYIGVRLQAICGNGRHGNCGRGEKVSGWKVREIGVVV